MQIQSANQTVRIVIGIPGGWRDRREIMQAIAAQSDGLLLTGLSLYDTRTRRSYELDVTEHDPQMRQAFAVAGAHWVTDADLEQIAAHTHTLYLLGPGGTIERAREMMRIAQRLLQCGGLAVKVETSGKAHRREDWAAMCAGTGPLVIYDAYVVFGVGQGTVYSCGMHKLGMRDALIQNDLPASEAVELLDTFLKYLLVESPEIQTGETFSISPRAPVYALVEGADTLFPPDDLFHNPYGRWRLLPQS